MNNPANIINLKDIGNIGSSDHSILIIDVLFENDFIDSNQQIPDWSKVDYVGFEQYLININCDFEFSSLNTEQSWTFFKERIYEGVELFVLLMRRDKNRPIWMTNRFLN